MERPKLLLLLLFSLTLGVKGALGQSQGTPLTPPYFNIAENRVVTVNATCGEGYPSKEVYCKLVGYDRFQLILRVLKVE